MKILNQTFQRTSSWMKRNARPLEAARWEALFDKRSKERVVRYLAAYQNKDGGFGHGIEPDFWLPSSSPMATWAAAQIVMELEVTSDETLVKSIASYLVDSWDEESGMWPSVLPETNLHPHAPWWHWKEDVQRNWMFNPGVELAAYLIHWSKEKSEAARIGWKSIDKAVDRLMFADLMDKHEINNYQQLIKILNQHNISFHKRSAVPLSDIIEKTNVLIDRCMEKDSSKWSEGYRPLPLDFIDHPEHPLYPDYKNLIEENLQFYQEEMNPEGVWEISWNWDEHSTAFAIASQQWKGILAIDRYKNFRAFDCLEY